MQYNKTLIEKAVKFLKNKNVEAEHWGAEDIHSESFAICVDVHNNRIWTDGDGLWSTVKKLSLIHISEPTRLLSIAYGVFGV